VKISKNYLKQIIKEEILKEMDLKKLMSGDEFDMEDLGADQDRIMDLEIEAFADYLEVDADRLKSILIDRGHSWAGMTPEDFKREISLPILRASRKNRKAFESTKNSIAAARRYLGL
jgi:hypothetical protein